MSTPTNSTDPMPTPRRRRVRSFIWWWTRRVALVVGAAALTLLAVRVYDTQRGPDLERWHLFVPDEAKARRLDRMEWEEYLERERAIFASVDRNVTQRIEDQGRVAYNRYAANSPVHPPGFARDWNRSYLDQPDGPPVGAVVLLHGLTDSPYSLRHVARHYRERGYVVVGIRLPAHGTVPAALTDITWEDWMAATRLAVREARRRTDAEAPLHIVGFSLGGALATKYALEAIENDALARPDRLILVSPMIGITRFARFAGLAGLPSVLPRFAKAAWLGIVPEFNPFKYNSFPVNGARQSHRLSVALQQQILRMAERGELIDLPPIITFQSVMDATVSTPAVVAALYAHVPENGSELVLFDVNRTVKFGPLMRPNADRAVERLLPPGPHRYDVAIVGNEHDGSLATIERHVAAGGSEAEERPLGIEYPSGIFSLSHVALPFPIDDALYGIEPTDQEHFGAHLGAITARGERGVLIVPLDSVFRIASNPFLPYVFARLDQLLDDPKPGTARTQGGAAAPTSVGRRARMRGIEYDEPRRESPHTP